MFSKLKNGYLTEEKFIIECLERNIPISRPIYNTEPYDFIIEVNNRFLSIQVKKSWVDKKGRNIVCLKSSYPRSNKINRVGEHENVDYIAILVGSQDWYIIPRMLVKDIKANICITKNGKYKNFYNNWDL